MKKKTQANFPHSLVNVPMAEIKLLFQFHQETVNIQSALDLPSISVAWQTIISEPEQKAIRRTRSLKDESCAAGTEGKRKVVPVLN